MHDSKYHQHYTVDQQKAVDCNTAPSLPQLPPNPTRFYQSYWSMACVACEARSIPPQVVFNPGMVKAKCEDGAGGGQQHH